VILGALAASCAPPARIVTHPAPEHLKAVVRVQDRWLLLHLSRPRDDATTRPLLLYVTGDGGWGGKDLDTYEHLRTFGQPVAGFSAPDYLDHLRGGADSLSPPELAGDFADIVKLAKERLSLPPSTEVILVGVSRGADLVVVAAAESALGPTVGGVLAVALTDEEEYVRHRPRRLFHPGAHEAELPPLEMVKPYDYIEQVRAPLCLIQSTNDQYVPAAKAREAFGPDAPGRKLIAIASRNHSFSDQRDALYDAMHRSILWILSSAAPAAAVRHSP
jgi:predicted alpha/beta hydrolase family esterase